MKQPKWVGIAGSIASGKTTLANIFREQGYPVIDADQVARQVVEPGTAGHRAVKQAFPEAFQGEVLDRAKLGQIIFSDPAKRQLLNSLLHPLIIAESRRQLAATSGLAFYEAPLLFEAGMADEFDLTIYVTASREIQIGRLMARDGIDRAYAEKKLAAFNDPGDKPSIILKNNGSREDFRRQAIALLERLIA